MLSAEEKFVKFMQAKYEKISSEKFISVSDGSQLRILKSAAPEETRNGFLRELRAFVVQFLCLKHLGCMNA